MVVNNRHRKLLLLFIYICNVCCTTVHITHYASARPDGHTAASVPLTNVRHTPQAGLSDIELVIENEKENTIVYSD